MEDVKKRRRRKHGSGRSRKKFWVRFILYFIYFSTIFLFFYYLFDHVDMLKEIKRDPEVFSLKVFGSSLLFALGLALWMRRDPKLTGK